MNFAEKHAVVTGGANGIGRCITERLLRAGVHVAMIDVDEQTGAALCDRYENLFFYHGDIADQTTLLAFADELKRKGTVDFIINNACVSCRGLLSDCSWENFEYVQRVGVTAPYFLVSVIRRSGLLADGASIINIASTRALQSQADTESYSAAKGGILALTHAMSISLAGQARVNAISPGWIETAAYHGDGNAEEYNTVEHSEADKRQHPAGRVGTPEDIAEMVMFLCDNSRAGFITGENIVIDGGMSKLMIYHNDNGWRLGG
ncbi:MAG: SDR family oxidoreductase [Methanosarcinales archaeon]|jgi:NAD(P)-dependent dehydrogenase (short-subunit alcohol dehydrogenase family)|nr:SDR family oxidoreductase [Methanosarcinales archaeon]